MRLPKNRMKIKKSRLIKLIIESINLEFEEDLGEENSLSDPQNLSYFGEGIVVLSQTNDIDKMEEHHQAAWLSKNCGLVRIGGGGFRNVFYIDELPQYAVKVAYTYSSSYSNMGKDHNKKEVEVFNSYPQIFPRVYAYDKKQYNWYIVDRLIPISSNTEMGKLAINAYKSFNAIARDIANAYSDIQVEDAAPFFGEILDIMLMKIGEGYEFNANDIMGVINDMSTYGKSYVASEYGAVYPALLEMLKDSSYYQKFLKEFRTDQNLVNFFVLSEQLGLNDLGMGNVGTNAAGDRLIVLDHSA